MTNSEIREVVAEYLYFNYAKDIAIREDSFDPKPWVEVNHRVQDIWRNDAERLLKWLNQLALEQVDERLTTAWSLGKWMIDRSE